MPQRQYFYTPIKEVSHNIGEKNGDGNYIGSTAYVPGAIDMGNPAEKTEPMIAGMICLRVDASNDRCVISLPPSTEQIYIDSVLVDINSVAGWASVDRGQIEAEYQSNDPLADDAVIDFTVEDE